MKDHTNKLMALLYALFTCTWIIVIVDWIITGELTGSLQTMFATVFGCTVAYCCKCAVEKWCDKYYGGEES